jgi:hypothetical protein
MLFMAIFKQGRRNWGAGGAAAPVALYQEGQGEQKCPFNLKECLGEIAIVRNISAILLRICFRKHRKCSHRASRIAQSPGGEPPHTPIIQ